MITEKTVTTTTTVETYCRPMQWAVVLRNKNISNDEYVIAQFHSMDDAESFIGMVRDFYCKNHSYKALESRRIIKGDFS